MATADPDYFEGRERQRLITDGKHHRLLRLPFSSRRDEFNHKSGWSHGHFFQKPDRQYLEKQLYQGQKLEDVGIDDKIEFFHRDFYGRVTWKPKDVIRYLSPTDATPKRLIVQATPSAIRNTPAGNWRRAKLKGEVPFVFRISQWAMSPSDKNKNGHRSLLGILSTLCRIPLVAPLLLLMLSIPINQAWVSSDFQDTYHEYPGVFWDYPKYAKNRLDMKPYQTPDEHKTIRNQSQKELSYKLRLVRPRQLMVLHNGKWTLDPNPMHRIPYLFFSWTAEQFDPSGKDRRVMEQVVQYQTRKAGLRAYWWDVECCAPRTEPALRNADVYRMCDVIRGAHLVCVLVPKLDLESKRQWGSRMWCLPEGLLCQSSGVKFCTSEGEEEVLSKLDMTDGVWIDDDSSGQPTRILAEHYSNVITLGRLELFSVALEALSTKKFSAFTKVDPAYALMGFLNQRVQLDGTENLFQALARLSIENDSDRIIERMACMFPDPSHHQDNIFRQLLEPDSYNTRLWDVQPLCQIAGVGGDDDDIILDCCRGVSIRWKAFPEMKYKRSDGFRRLLAEITLRSGAYTSVLGAGLLLNYGLSLYADLEDQELGDQKNVNNNSGLSSNHTDANPNDANLSRDFNLANDILFIIFGILAILFSLLLALVAPAAVRRLYGGKITESAPWLIGFEGVLPVQELEKLIFGNYLERLTYEPSSTPYSERKPYERLGCEPLWVKESTSDHPTHAPPALKPGHRFFTLVDTGQLTVSIFSAERPPSVALICGREGGMLRTLLCHYERSNNCLYRETVIRMDSTLLNRAQELSWIKLSLGRNMPSPL